MSTIQNLLEEKFQNALPINMVEVKVEITPSELFQEVAVVYAMEAERVSRFTSSTTAYLPVEDIEKYLNTLLYLRVARVNGVKNEITRGYHNDFRSYNIPTFIHTLLVSIGKATDYDFGFTFIPVISIQNEDLLSPSEMIETSRKFGILSLEGLSCVDTGISTNPNGELATMATFSIQKEILSYRKDHPIYGFYAAFFNHKILGEVILPEGLRIRYGAQRDYISILHNIV